MDGVTGWVLAFPCPSLEHPEQPSEPGCGQSQGSRVTGNQGLLVWAAPSPSSSHPRAPRVRSGSPGTLQTPSAPAWSVPSPAASQHLPTSLSSVSGVHRYLLPFVEASLLECPGHPLRTGPGHPLPEPFTGVSQAWVEPAALPSPEGFIQLPWTAGMGGRSLSWVLCDPLKGSLGSQAVLCSLDRTAGSAPGVLFCTPRAFLLRTSADLEPRSPPSPAASSCCAPTERLPRVSWQSGTRGELAGWQSPAPLW